MEEVDQLVAGRSVAESLLMEPGPYRRLVLLRRWTPDEYTEYLQRMAAAALRP